MFGITNHYLRIRDPIHDLITFDIQDDRDRLAWQLVNTREFQRLRRIKQLGFSELVFPGATHTRFSHCLGAYSVARKLIEIIQKKVPNFDKTKAFLAGIAALLHDLGHGPFSHVFEGVQSGPERGRRHEDWTAEIIRGDSEVHKVLEAYDPRLASDVALLLSKEDPTDIYDAVVSSQFDADRLDYLQRDRYMTGTHTGAFDFAWLLDCLETGKINIAQGEEELVEVDGLYLNHKGLAAAEGYLLSRFHLYSQVYLHKTTRSAERMLGALFTKLAEAGRAGNHGATALSRDNSLFKFFTQDHPTVTAYLALDDALVWSGISEMTNASDELISSLAGGLRDRKLYKCIDVGELAKRVGSDSLPQFRRRLQEFGGKLGTVILKDEAPLTAYSIHEYEDPSALQKVLIGRQDGSGRSDDIAERSPIVGSIGRQKIFRVYGQSETELKEIDQLWREVAR